MEVFDLSKNRPLMSASTPKTSSTLDKTPRAAADPMAVILLSTHDATATGPGPDETRRELVQRNFCHVL